MSKPQTPKRKEKMEITYEDYLTPPWQLPNPAFIALVREMEKEIGKEKTHEIIRKLAEKMAREHTTRSQSKDPETIIKEAKECFTPSSPLFKAVFDYEVIDYSPLDFEVRFTGCLLAEKYRAMGAGDIGDLMVCNSDYVVTEALHPDLKLDRKKTLMKGDRYCDCRWSLREPSN